MVLSAAFSYVSYYEQIKKIDNLYGTTETDPLVAPIGLKNPHGTCSLITIITMLRSSTYFLHFLLLTKQRWLQSQNGIEKKINKICRKPNEKFSLTNTLPGEYLGVEILKSMKLFNNNYDQFECNGQRSCSSTFCLLLHQLNSAEKESMSISSKMSLNLQETFIKPNFYEQDQLAENIIENINTENRFFISNTRPILSIFSNIFRSITSGNLSYILFTQSIFAEEEIQLTDQTTLPDTSYDYLIFMIYPQISVVHLVLNLLMEEGQGDRLNYLTKTSKLIIHPSKFIENFPETFRNIFAQQISKLSYYPELVWLDYLFVHEINPISNNFFGNLFDIVRKFSSDLPKLNRELNSMEIEIKNLKYNILPNWQLENMKLFNGIDIAGNDSYDILSFQFYLSVSNFKADLNLNYDRNQELVTRLKHRPSDECNKKLWKSFIDALPKITVSKTDFIHQFDVKNVLEKFLGRACFYLMNSRKLYNLDKIDRIPTDGHVITISRSIRNTDLWYLTSNDKVVLIKYVGMILSNLEEESLTLVLLGLKETHEKHLKEIIENSVNKKEDRLWTNILKKKY
ncbi:hypothetical protein SNEBB_003634 [Seison nebaliae]|nr:hypothetical protein SNEBB_003634 [Seison nebaliae]